MIRLRYLHLSALLALVGACQGERPSNTERPAFAGTQAPAGHAPRLHGITHVRLSVPVRQTPRPVPTEPWVLNDPLAVAPVVAFMTARDTLWRKATAPQQSSDPMLFADFYRGADHVATVTHRMDELTIEGQHGRFVQPLSVFDGTRFLALVIAPLKLVPLPPRPPADAAPAPQT